MTTVNNVQPEHLTPSRTLVWRKDIPIMSELNLLQRYARGSVAVGNIQDIGDLIAKILIES